MDRRFDINSVEGRINQELKLLIAIRKDNSAFAGMDLEVIGTGSEHILGYSRSNDDQRVLIFANFSEQEQMIPGDVLRIHSSGSEMIDLSKGHSIPKDDYRLKPYELLCLSLELPDSLQQ
jgi:amylosucrase/maltose alpha-D-glucosyltransferase/alpha-amylase